MYHFLSLYSILPWANGTASKTKHKGVFSRKTSNHNRLQVWFWGVILWHIDVQCWRPCSYQSLMNNYSKLFSVITHLVVLFTHSLMLASKYHIICWVVQNQILWKSLVIAFSISKEVKWKAVFFCFVLLTESWKHLQLANVWTFGSDLLLCSL